MKRLMLIIWLCLGLIFSNSTTHAQTGASLATSINIGSYGSTGGPTFTDIRNNSTYNGVTYTNTMGQSSPEVYYSFTLTSPGTIDFSLCASDFDTYIHILNTIGNVISYQDDSFDCGTRSHMTATLNPGTYYLAVEGYSSYTGNINLVVNSLNSSVTNAPPVISYPTLNILAVGTSSNISPGNSGGMVGGGGGVITSTYATGFYNPISTTCDAAGNVYVADAGNHQIKKIAPGGTVTVLAGTGFPGYVDGSGIGAQFTHPTFLAIDAFGNIFVSDQQNHRIRKITPAGVVSTFAGSGVPGFGDGTGTGAFFQYPMGLTFDAVGNLFVADAYNHRIRKITPAGVVTTFAGTGSIGSTNSTAMLSTFNYPMGVAFDGSGTLYITDRYNHMVRKITTGGTVSTLAGSGSMGFADGTGSGAMFKYPNHLAIDNSGNLYLTDQQNYRIRKITPGGVVTTLAGNGSASTVNGPGPTSSFNTPYGLSIDATKSNLYVAENVANGIRKVSLSSSYTITPSLPAGLSFDASTGVISGTPLSILSPSTYTVTASNSYGSSSAITTIQIVSVLDPYINSIKSVKYDDDGVLMGESKSYYSDNGKSIQSQVKNISANQVLATENLYDSYGRIAGSSLAAPINGSQLSYKSNFIVNSSGGKYDYRNFDGSKTNSPDPVGATGIGTLGWYYSNNNNLEPFVPSTSYPYNRSTFYSDGIGAVKKQAGVGEVHKMGTGYQNSLNVTGIISELDFYNQLRTKFFAESEVGSRNSLSGNGMLEIGQDVNGIQAANITDLEGRVLMTAKVGLSSGLTVSNTANISNQGGYSYDINWNENGVSPSYVPYINVNGGYITVLKSTNNWVSSTTMYNGAAVNYNSTGNTQGSYKILSSTPFTVTYQVPASNIQTSSCKSCNARLASDGKDQIHYFRLFTTTSVTITGTGWKLYNLSGDEQEIATSGTTFSLPTGYYKVSIPQIGNATISYSTIYSDISFNFYNQVGQLICSIAPEGVNAIINNGLSSYATLTNVPFKTSYEYDLRGRMVANTQTDAGRTEFIYRNDGNIRFSQNSLQQSASPKRFSYTNYDRLGRTIESGEFVETATITFASAKTNFPLQESLASDGGLVGGTKQEWVKTYYDVVNNTHGISGYSQDPLTLKGVVSWTEGASGNKTWYNYDGEGRLIWIIRGITGLGSKTIDYSYDVKGNISILDFQKNVAGERFTYEFEYDLDNRINTVYTTAAVSGRKLQAKYYYYLHGPLKRVEVAGNLQGIDYVYTAQGLLKSINHPTVANDPGKDGTINAFSPDVFGLTLEYFNSDYTRSATNINSISTGAPADFGGRIVGQSWRTQKPNVVVASYGASVNDPTMATYTYNNKYQFSDNKFGTPNFGSNSFTEAIGANREYGVTYDANGNIKALNRTNSTSTNIASYVYSYLANTNKLSQVSNYASYGYDALGQMISQVRTSGSQGFYVDYDLKGKVTAIYSNPAKTILRVSFSYDESGNRVRKTDHILNTITYYVYGLSGNLLAVYDNKGTAMQQKEIPVYAASRIGSYNKLGSNYQYELSDHLGNVRAVINEVKQGNGTADVVYYSDYYPYGSSLTLAANDYRYGYQGQYAEVDKETGWNNFNLRAYDPGIGRWMTTDPYKQFDSPYLGMGNNPVSSIDPDGGFVDPPVKGPTLKEVTIVGKLPFKLRFYTTSMLRHDAFKAGIISQNMAEINRIVGNAFQNHATKNFGWDKNNKPYPTKVRLAYGRGSVIPDAVNDIKVKYFTWTGFETETYPESSFVEVKAVDGIIHLSHDQFQIAGLIDAAANSPAGARGAANLTFVTTANTIIGVDVLLAAQIAQVQVHQSVAYKIEGTNMVGFTPILPLTLNGHRSPSFPVGGTMPAPIVFPKMLK